MGAGSTESLEGKYDSERQKRFEVSTKEVDTAAELASGEGELDPAEALRVRYYTPFSFSVSHTDALITGRRSISIYFL